MTARPFVTLLTVALALAPLRAAQAQVTVEVPTWEVGTTLSGYATNGIDVAVGDDGNILFVWDNGTNYTNQGNLLPAPSNSLSARVYTPTAVPVAGVYRVDVSGGVNPWVFAGANGDGYLVAWQDVLADSSPDEYGIRIRGRRLDATGAPAAPPLLIDVDEQRNPFKDVPVVAGLAGGETAVVWLRTSAITARVLDASGAAPAPQFTVSNLGAWWAHDATGLANGDFVAVWSSNHPAFTSALRVFAPDGAPVTGVLPVATSFLATDVAASPFGGFAVIGKSADYEQLWLRLFADDGTPTSDEILVHAMTTDYYVSQEEVTFGNGSLLVEWVEYTRAGHSGITGIVYDPSGTALAPAQTITSTLALRLRAARLPDGRIVSNWEGFSLGNPNRTASFANIVSICDPGAEDCAPRPTPTPGPTPQPTPRPTAAPHCGDGNLDGGEQCDDGNTRDGDGCSHLCIIEVPRHDSVMVPEKSIDVVIPAQQEEVTKVVPLQVRNADVGERPGHVIRLLADDGTCPAGTVVGLPDFERGEPGDQDTVVVAGGTPKTALLVVRATREGFSGTGDETVPQRCTLIFTAETDIAGNVDPTPENNTISVELNVVAAGVSPSGIAALAGEPAAASAVGPLPEFFVGSAKPLGLRIRPGRSSTSKAVKFTIASGTSLAGGGSRTVTVTASDGDCPPGTFAVGDLDRVADGQQSSVALSAGRKTSGRLMVSVAGSGFTSTSPINPARCTGALVVTSPDGDSGVASHTTRVVVDVVDGNDFLQR